MISNHLKIAIRTLRKNKIYTAINIIGLAVGIAAVLLIFRMVTYELSFNKNFKNYDRIGRVVSIQKTAEEGDNYNVCTPIPAMNVMESTVSQFEAMSRVHELWATLTIPNPDGGPPLKKFRMDPGETSFFAESAFLKVFDFQWIAGGSKNALDEPGAVVLTKTWAIKCFDRWEEAMGKTLMLDNLVPVVVKGVIEDLPTNCDFTFPFLVSYPTLKANAGSYFYDEEWGSCSSNNQVYALLRDPGQMDAANASLAKVGEKEYAGRTGKQNRFHLLQPLSDLHYNENYHNSGSHRTSKTRLQVLSAIGILILILACFNFINLATAQASLRAKEVGVRKTLGSKRGQLIGQFMSETGLIVLIAVVLGANLAYFTAPLLKFVSDVPDSLPFFSNPLVWAFLAMITVSVSLLAGLYPAIALAGFQPIKALKNNIDNHFFGGTSLRKSLVVLQFTIAQGLIIGAIITILQLDYIRSRDLGFNDDLVYTFSFNSDSATIVRQEALRQGLLQIPTIEAVSFNSDQPLSGSTWTSNFRFGTRPEDEPFGITMKFADASYQETYGIRLLAGEWFESSDTMRQAVVNMTTLRKLGIRDPQEVIKQKINVFGVTLEIVGVAEDFHTHSFREEHLPLLITTRKEFYWEAGVKIRPDNLANTTAAIQKAFDKVLPEQVFAGRFLDESIANFYQDDNRLSATTKGFGVLAILISCLGLFGLATHAAAQRIKEIGIRKVLGASVVNIVELLSKDFLKLVLIALVVASPLAWYAMNKWLENFVFRINIQWWVFAIVGVLAVVIALATVSFQAIRAAVANPVESLKNE
ncbi:MAG: FtsX-like permease family protein [Saprospiraceae bacterium]|nr:FtsX-like permease family protein [Saprospiraceae bacterium]